MTTGGRSWWRDTAALPKWATPHTRRLRWALPALLLITAVWIAAAGFGISGLLGPDGRPDPLMRFRCSAPVLQIVDVPKPRLSPGGHVTTVTDVPQRCKEVGRYRLAESVLLLIVAALVAVIVSALWASVDQVDLDPPASEPRR